MLWNKDSQCGTSTVGRHMSSATNLDTQEPEFTQINVFTDSLLQAKHLAQGAKKTVFPKVTYTSSPWNGLSSFSDACLIASFSLFFFSFFSFFERVLLKFWITPSFSCFSGPLL